jgi:hypothetical protein
MNAFLIKGKNMANPKKTFYKINSEGELDVIRRTTCPEGWLIEKPAFCSISKKKPVQVLKSIEKEIDNEELKKEVLRLRQENLELREQLEKEKAEVAAKETFKIESKFRDRLEMENIEIERTSFRSRQNKRIEEEEYYKIKNIANGLEARLQSANETIERMRQQHNHLKKNLF